MITSSPAHTALSVQQFLTKTGVTPVPHPPYSPNLTPSDFFLFPWMKKVLKGKCFADVEEVKQKMAAVLKLMNSNTVSVDVFYQTESTLKVTEVETCKNKCTIFYN